MNENMDPERLFRSAKAAHRLDFDELAVLADALGDAGFPQADDLQQILVHIRQDAPKGFVDDTVNNVMKLWPEAVKWAERRYYASVLQRLSHIKTDDLDAMEAIVDDLRRADYVNYNAFLNAIRKFRKVAAKGRPDLSDDSNAYWPRWQRLIRIRTEVEQWLDRKQRGPFQK